MVLVASFALRHPEAYVPLFAFAGLWNRCRSKGCLIPFQFSLGAAVGLLLVRKNFAQTLPSLGFFHLVPSWRYSWLGCCPHFPTIVLERCPPAEVCNPYDCEQSAQSELVSLLLSFLAVAVSLIANRNAGAPPNTSLKRTREDKVPSSYRSVRAAQLNR